MLSQVFKLGWVRETIISEEIPKVFMSRFCGSEHENPRETCQHLPSIPEAGSKDVTQSHDTQPQSICSENLHYVSHNQERTAKHRRIVNMCSGALCFEETPFLRQKGNGNFKAHFIRNEHTRCNIMV